MRFRSKPFAITAALLAAVALADAQSRSDPAKLALEAAKQKVVVDRDVNGAITLYKEIVSRHKDQRAVVAEALLRMAQIYQTIDFAESRATYQEIVREYADQKAIASEAESQLRSGASPTITPRHVCTDCGDSGNGVALALDGRTLAFTDQNGDIAVRNVSTGATTRLLRGSGASQDSDGFADTPIVSPDARHIAFQWTPSGTSDAHGQLRVTVNEAGSKPRVLIDDPQWSCVFPADWSPDGQALLLAALKRDGTWQLVLASAVDGKARVIEDLGRRIGNVGGRNRATFSPDGKYIAYAALASDLGQKSVVPANSTPVHIYIRAVDGSAETAALVTGAGINDEPLWTPDGSHVLFVSNRSGTFGLWAVPVQKGGAAGAPFLVRAGTGRIWPVGVTRSGSYHFLQSDSAGSNVFAAEVDPETTRVRGPVTLLSKNEVGSNRGPAWSPDGKSLAFKRSRNRNAGQPYDLVVLSLESGQERTYAPPPTAPSTTMGSGRAFWLRDGKGLLQAFNDGAFYRIDLTSGELVRVATVSPGTHNGLSALSRDDKTLYFAPSKGASEIFSADLDTSKTTSVFSLPPGFGSVVNVLLSPDDKTLAITGLAVLARVETDGTNYRELYRAPRLGSGLWGTWTRDGRAILVGQNTEGNDWQVMRVPADGGKPEPIGLTVTANQGHNVALSPDGSRIAFSNFAEPPQELLALDNVLGPVKRR